MSFYLSGGVEVLGFISPTEPTDEYPVIDPLYGIDGFRNVNTLSDLNSIPNLRRRAGMVVGVSGGTQYYKLNPQPWNGTITDWSTFSLGGGSFTGGTVTGDTIFTQGVTATTFSASTYLGLPLDVYVTGGTYSNGTIIFTNNSGGTFNVVGLNTGTTINLSGGTGISVSGTSPNFIVENTLPDQIVNLSGGTNINVTGTYPNFGIEFTGVTSSPFTGGTVTGNTIFTQGVTATTFSASTYLGLPLDVYTTGFTFNPSTYDISIERNDGVTLTQNLGILATDVTITGGTYDPLNGSITFVNNTGGTFTVSGFITGFTDIQVTGYTYQDNIFTISDSSGNTFSATIDVMTGLTVNGLLSATTLNVNGVNITGDTYTTGGTYSNGTIIFDYNTGGNYQVSGLYTGETPNLSLFSLPTPFLKLSNNNTSIETFNSSIVDLVNEPVISTNDLSFEQINHGVWIEMLVYRKKRKSYNGSSFKKGYVIPPDWTWDSINNVGINSLQQELLILYPTKTIMNRGGETQNVYQSRPNHYKVTGNTQSINLGYYLNGRFFYNDIEYYLPDGSINVINLPIPVSRYQQYGFGKRFCYDGKLIPTYLKFRYIMFDPNFNNGKGRFITGPLSSTIKITLETFPFIPTTPFCNNPPCTPTELQSTCITKIGVYDKLKCNFESNVP